MEDERLMKELQDATEELNKLTEEVSNAEQKTSESVDPILEQAIKDGYNPNYDGPDKKTPEQFIRDGSFFKKINAQKKDIEDLKSTIQDLVRQHKKMEEMGYQKAIDELKAMRNQAIEEGDVVKVNALDDHIQQEREKMRNSEVHVEPNREAPPEVHPAAVNFKEKNSNWFFNYDVNKSESELTQEERENKEMTEMALIYDEHLGKNKIDPERAMHLIEDRVQQYYKHRFENPKRDEPTAVASASRSTDGSLSTKSLVSRMTPRQKNQYEMFSSFDKSFGTIEDYAKHLEKIGELKND